MLVIGLTGGVGSGKSTVSKLFAEYNVPIIDADLIARELVEPEQPALLELLDHFGPDILMENGELDRRRLRELVFADDEQRKTLENILHPRIRQVMLERLEQVDGPYTVMVVPLLVDTGHWEMIDQILVVDVDEETQIQRIMQRDGVNRKQAQAIIDTQISRNERLEAADQILRNAGDITELRNQVKLLHQAYMAEVETTQSNSLSAKTSNEFTVYELPLVERIRTFMRLEQLFNRVQYCIQSNDIHTAHSVIKTLVEINSLAGRGDLKGEIIKELERQHASLTRHIDETDIDQSVLKKLLRKLADDISLLHKIREQLDQHLQNDLLYNSVKQRLSIPGGTCNFDLPLYNHWIHLSKQKRLNTLEEWFKPYRALWQTIATCLDIIRNSSDPVLCTAHKGYFEEQFKLRTDIQLIRVFIDSKQDCYPTISASKHRLNIRFMRWLPGQLNSPQITSDIKFKLMICGI